MRATWKTTTPNSDPQTDTVYLHVDRVKRRPTYIMDTVYHIGIEPDSSGDPTQRWAQSQCVIRQAKDIIAIVRKSKKIQKWVEAQFTEGFAMISNHQWQLICLAVRAMERTEKGLLTPRM